MFKMSHYREKSNAPGQLLLIHRRNRVIGDLSLCAGNNERRFALAYLPFCRPGDLIAYDRGDYSRALLVRYED